MRLKYRHRMFLIGPCSLAYSERTGQVSAGDDSHLSLVGLCCGRQCLLSAALPNSHLGRYSLLATMTPINDPAEHLLTISRVEMTLTVPEGGKFIFGNRYLCCITLNKVIMTTPGSVSRFRGGDSIKLN